MKDRLANILQNPKPNGNIIFFDDTFGLFWDVSFQSNIEALLFNRHFLALLGNLFYNKFGIGCFVSDDSIVANVEDSSEIIIKPTTWLATTNLVSNGNYYTCDIYLNKQLFNNNWGEFINESFDIFNFEINKLYTDSLKIKNHDIK